MAKRLADEGDGEVLLRLLEVLESEDRPTQRSLADTLGIALAGQGRHVDAEPILLDAHRAIEADYGADDKNTREAVAAISGFYEEWGKPDQARSWRTRLPG